MKIFKKSRLPLFVLMVFALIAGCISVSIKNKEATRSDKFKYSNPASPFEKVSSEQADLAWQNSRTGNTIAVLTECSESKDPSLQTLEGETVQALNSYQVIKSNTIQFQEREALRSNVEGLVDGIPVKMSILTFKKNFCAYTLTYLGRAKGFEKDLPAFESFLQRFQAQ